MSGFGRFFLGALVACALSPIVVACGGSSHSSGGNQPPPTANGNITVSSFTVSPTTITSGQQATFNWTLSNPGNASSSNITLQAFLSQQTITAQNFQTSAVTPLGAATTVSAVPGGSSSSGSFTANVSSPNIHPPAQAFVALVAIPQSSAGQTVVSTNVPVSLQ
jgi:uncharacterized repeat protein (TIGR01451 family)